MLDIRPAGLTRRVWQVGALCRAVADALDARFNPVAVRGELSGFSRAASGHCYFTLKDPQGQVRCAMFRRAAQLLNFQPRDGDQVEIQGRLDVYDARGDLQLIVESLSRAGQGSLFEQFLQLKQRLQDEGLFDSERKRPLPVMPRGIGLVTSLGAAALHDVATCLQRRAPHVPVVLVPAAVQGAQAPAELCRALGQLAERGRAGQIDVILLVRGGGSLEDLQSFNDERVARALVASPVPVVVGVGHETDFTIADFCADLRAPTPTAAAELVATSQQTWLDALSAMQQRLARAGRRRLDSAQQRLDGVSTRLGRPSALMAQRQQQLARAFQRLRYAMHGDLGRRSQMLQRQAELRAGGMARQISRQHQRLEHASLRLSLLDPRLVLRRGYALIARADGSMLVRAADAKPGEAVAARLADGELELSVTGTPPRLSA